MATNITNFNQQAMDQQMFITDLRQRYEVNINAAALQVQQ